MFHPNSGIVGGYKTNHAAPSASLVGQEHELSKHQGDHAKCHKNRIHRRLGVFIGEKNTASARVNLGGLTGEGLL